MSSKFWIVFSAVVLGIAVYLKYSPDGDSLGTLEEFVNKHGFILETHQATTKDGYILTIHRIPGRIDEKHSGEKKPPIFLMHGILCTSFDWVILGNRSMSFILADAGYDVWIGNNRGNTYSRQHDVLDPDGDPEFWEYSYNEIGIYDLPAMIDKVLEVTDEEQLTYLGFSEGFTSFLVMGSQRPEYNNKIKTMHGFAPVTNMYKIKSPVLKFLRLTLPTFGPILEFFNQNELLTVRHFAPFIKTVAKIPVVGARLVRYIMHLIGGSYEQLSLNSMKTIFVNFPAGISLRQIQHYVQGSRTGRFGPYFKKEPEEDYNLSKVTALIFLYYGQDDYLVSNDILLNEQVPKLNIKKIFKIPERTFNHVDFIWGNNISALTSEALKNIMENR